MKQQCKFIRSLKNWIINKVSCTILLGIIN